MSNVSRRKFLAGMTAAGAAALGTTEAGRAEEKPKIRSGADRVTLGKCGVETSVLGLGTGTRSGREQRLLGFDGFAKLVRHAYDRGVRYIDTADMYRMHALVRHAMKGLPREHFFLQSKSRAKDAEDAKADIERIRHELGVDYLDSLLMHCMTKKPWPADMRPVMDVLYEAKEKGHVRAVGVSCHGFDPLVTSAECDWIDIHLVRINPFQVKMDETPEAVSAEIRKMHDRGRGVIGMKIFGESGFDDPKKRLESLKYVLGLGCVDAFTIGFSQTGQIDETLGMIQQATA